MLCHICTLWLSQLTSWSRIVCCLYSRIVVEGVLFVFLLGLTILIWWTERFVMYTVGMLTISRHHFFKLQGMETFQTTVMWKKKSCYSNSVRKVYIFTRFLVKTIHLKPCLSKGLGSWCNDWFGCVTELAVRKFWKGLKDPGLFLLDFSLHLGVDWTGASDLLVNSICVVS